MFPNQVYLIKYTCGVFQVWYISPGLLLFRTIEFSWMTTVSLTAPKLALEEPWESPSKELVDS